MSYRGYLPQETPVYGTDGKTTYRLEAGYYEVTDLPQTNTSTGLTTNHAHNLFPVSGQTHGDVTIAPVTLKALVQKAGFVKA